MDLIVSGVRFVWILAALLAVAVGIALLGKPGVPMPPTGSVPAAAPRAASPPPPPRTRSPLPVDPEIPAYVPGERVQGVLRSVGSDTMNNLMTLWAEGMFKFHPGFQIAIEGKGSSTAMPALVAGVAQIGPMSREMKPKEIEDFEKKHGFRPTAIATCTDLLAVYVHRDNPIRGLTLPQVDAIFSKERKAGHGSDIRTWGDLGLTGEWSDRNISLYGRNSASGTYGYFKDRALLRGAFKAAVLERPGSSSVVRGVATDRYGIGYSGIGYRTAGVRALPIAPEEGKPFAEAVPDAAHVGSYPLSRHLYLYVVRAPDAALDPPLREFLRFVLSREGQAAIVKDGYVPLSAAQCRDQRAKVGIR